MKVCKNGKCRELRFCVHERLAIGILALIVLVGVGRMLGVL